jgi:hypothetical protein
MRLIILLGTLAIALPFIISGVALPLGSAVSDRFLERPTHRGEPSYTISRETGVGSPLDAASLIDWVTRNGELAERLCDPGYPARYDVLSAHQYWRAIVKICAESYLKSAEEGRSRNEGSPDYVVI